MRRFDHQVALVVGALLLAAPAVGASCGDGGPMAPQCPMPESAGEAGSAAHGAHVTAGVDTASAPCHGAPQAPPAQQNCCDARSAPEPIDGLSFECPETLAAPEALDVRAAAPLPPVTPQRAVPAIADRVHDPGRYTLFSSFLL